jgi:adenylate cyclase class 2
MEALNVHCISGRHFEDNYLLDFPDERLRSQQCLLRIRSVEGRGILTYKGMPLPNGIFKSREELETGVADAAIALRLLERIGMQICFQYQKYRREFVVEGVHVTVDETPIGNYAEIEGPEEGIRNLASKLGIEESRFIRSSYYDLYLEYCLKKGRVPHFMVF